LLSPPLQGPLSLATLWHRGSLWYGCRVHHVAVLLVGFGFGLFDIVDPNRIQNISELFKRLALDIVDLMRHNRTVNVIPLTKTKIINQME